MTVLSTTERARTASQWMRQAFGVATFDKAALTAAVAAVDDWAEANAASYNSALPAAFRTSATASQKALLLAYVLMRRAGILHAEEDG